jgi:hypothetical protein
MGNDSETELVGSKEKENVDFFDSIPASRV